jgi:hypothetical protein
VRRDGVVGGGGVVIFCGSLRMIILCARERDRSAGNYWREPTDFLALTKS